MKKRMPRHNEQAEEDWFLAKEVPSGQRWFEAEQTMLRDIEAGHFLPMSEAFDKIRRDLSASRVAWYPQKCTTMVEGRPVQVVGCILPPLTLWWSRTPTKQKDMDIAEPDAR